MHVFEELEREGFDVSYIDVNSEGIVDIDALRQEIRPDTTLVSIMLVNNEVGTVQPMYDIAEVIEIRISYFMLMLFKLSVICQ